MAFNLMPGYGVAGFSAGGVVVSPAGGVVVSLPAGGVVVSVPDGAGIVGVGVGVGVVVVVSPQPIDASVRPHVATRANSFFMAWFFLFG
jgi:hypothetical protein